MTGELLQDAGERKFNKVLLAYDHAPVGLASEEGLGPARDVHEDVLAARPREDPRAEDGEHHRLVAGAQVNCEVWAVGGELAGGVHHSISIFQTKL